MTNNYPYFSGTPFLSKSKWIGALLFFSLAVVFQATAQKEEIVVIFKPWVPNADIMATLAALNGTQIGFTNPSQARLWEIECAPGNPCKYAGAEYIDVNEVIKKVSSETKTESIGKNYPTVIPPFTNISIQDPSGPPSVPQLTSCNSSPIITTKGVKQENIIIALIDSGVDSLHNYFKGKNYFHGNSRSFVPYNAFNDQNGHGTHIAGIIKMMDDLGGSANSFKIMNLRTQLADGSGKVWNAIRAVDWANKKGAHIINMSLGYVHDPLVDSLPVLQPLQVAINMSNSMNDILVVASAGNDAVNIDSVRHYPSAFVSPNIISIASDSCSTYFSSWFSNFGNKNVDIAAPGENILGPDLYYSMAPDKWTRKTGTSMAAGIVTGATGLLATHMGTIADGPLKCAILEGADFKGYPVATEGTLHTPNAKDSLLYGGCATATLLVAPPASTVLAGDQLNSKAKEQPLISPMPFSNTVHFSIKSEQEGVANWSVFDAFGRTVGSGSSQVYPGQTTITWDGSTLPAGLYWFSYENGGQHLVQKMIKQ